MKNEFLDRLRAQTETMHRSLEQNDYAACLMSDSITFDDYADYLEKMSGFVSVFEQKALPVTSQLMPDVHPKAGLLAGDLAKMGRPVSEVSTFDSEKIANAYSSIPKALGGLYVMEGSTLGGMVIYQHLHRRLGEGIEGKASYFSVHGKETGSRWKKFLEAFCHHVQTNKWEDEVIEGAVSTFRMLNDWMQEKQTVTA